MKELEGKSIAIVGGTGTLGKAIVKFLVLNNVRYKSLSIVSRDELKQLEMISEYPEKENRMMYFLGDVRDKERLIELFRGIDYVIHAAAIKHVVMAEKNPNECNKTNVQGSQNLLDACLKSGVRRALLVSTDKAENPIGVYGKSKQEAEQLFLDSEVDALVVRLGNIVNSRGSVWHLFNEQRKTGKVKVTHPEATRFMIDQEDAAEFVVTSLIERKSGIVYPAMQAFSVLSLAKELCPNCEIEWIGLRPGDKLHEELGGRSSASVLEGNI